MTDQQPIDTQLSNHQEMLSPELQQVVKKIQDNKTAWITAREKESKATEQVDTLRQRQQKAISDYELMKNQRSALLNDSNGEFTPEVKKLRAKMIEQRETADDLEELLALRESDLTTLPWDTGHAASDYVREHNYFVDKHVDTLLGRFLSEHGAELLGLLNLKYQHLRRTNSKYIDGVITGVNDADILLKDFICETFLRPAKEDHDVINIDPALSIIGISPDAEASADCHKKPTPGQILKYKNLKQSDGSVNANKHDARSNNLVEL
ncbi:hypothetical protein [Buttiauxella noackiae]|uniref:phage polarity suppression protein n=1 Tax=Buttiauxella noackiae TaxID=82992 RepID=UPI0005591DF1|nr:hypothetical protein [Buttiauxella noackiae]